MRVWGIVTVVVVAWVLVSVGVAACVAIGSHRPDPTAGDVQGDDDQRESGRAA